MNEFELKKLWQTTNEKWEESFLMNRKNMYDITRVKVHSIIGSMKPIKIFTLLIGILWVGIGVIALGGIYLNAFPEANKFFLFSATAQVLLTAFALFIYVYQLTKIYRIDVSDPILQTQKTLAQLKLSTIWATRILFLQLPVWTTFWWNESMLTDWNVMQWVIALLVTGSFTFFALWFFINIKIENSDKKWFKIIFIGKEWTPLIKSLDLLKQIDEYSSDISPETNASA